TSIRSHYESPISTLSANGKPLCVGSRDRLSLHRSEHGVRSRHWTWIGWLLSFALVDLHQHEIGARRDALEAAPEVDANDQDLDHSKCFGSAPCRGEACAAHKRYRFDRTSIRIALLGIDRGNGGVLVTVEQH